MPMEPYASQRIFVSPYAARIWTRPSTGEKPMEWNQLEGNWKQIKGKIKEKWGDLTDDDLTKIQGNREQFEGEIQKRYGKSKEAVRQDVDDWLKTLH
jgi:uncharacterized protein YjbJ (UPF0337 family)